MPLEKAKDQTKKEINKAVSNNIKELHSYGKRPRSQKQIIAIAEAAARKED